MAEIASTTILITGATDGLAHGVAIRAAELGRDLIVHGRSKERLEALSAEVQELPGLVRTGIDFPRNDAGAEPGRG